MTPIDETYRLRLALLVSEHGSQSALSAKIKKSPAQISQWLNKSKDPKTGKGRVMSRQTAEEIEKAIGKPSGWMSQPISPFEPGALHLVGEADRQMNAVEQAHEVSPEPATLPPVITMEEAMGEKAKLPQEFRLAMPDGSLASTPQGTLLYFSISAKPRPGWGVFFEDRSGYRHVRRFQRVRGDHWKAEATVAGYASFDSIEDGLTIIASMIGKMDGGV